MKKTLLAIALISNYLSVLAETKYPSNPILRPVTLNDGALAITAGVVAGEEKDENR